MRRYGDCRYRRWCGHRGRRAVGSATAPARPGGLGPTPAADVGTAASTTDVGAAASTARLYSVPSLLTD
jgi:hypothetical protein